MKVIIGVEQEPRIQFTLAHEEGYKLPDIIKLKDGSLLVLVGKYASPGNKFSYRRAEIRELTSFVEIKPWVQYTKLTG